VRQSNPIGGVVTDTRVKIADVVFVAAALLHREHPERSDFSVGEIVDRAHKESELGSARFRPGVRTHVTQHCVSNKKPDPGRYRILVETSPGRRRLYREGDSTHPGRKKGKVTPDKSDLPARYHPLLDWYVREYSRGRPSGPVEDPILALRGLGKDIWGDEDPDEYVRKLREGWE
jgi:hypothetical protein